MRRQERSRRRKEGFQVEACNTRCNPMKRRLKPRRRCADTGAEKADRARECDHLSGSNGTARGLGGLAARAQLSQPPNAAGIGNNRACSRLLAGIINNTSNGDDIGTDRACRNMRVQMSGHALRPAGLENCGQYFGFQLAFNRFHHLFRSGVWPGATPKNEASLRRARNNMGLSDAGRKPNTLAISR